MTTAELHALADWLDETGLPVPGTINPSQVSWHRPDDATLAALMALAPGNWSAVTLPEDFALSAIHPTLPIRMTVFVPRFAAERDLSELGVTA